MSFSAIFAGELWANDGDFDEPSGDRPRLRFVLPKWEVKYSTGSGFEVGVEYRRGSTLPDESSFVSDRPVVARWARYGRAADGFFFKRVLFQRITACLPATVRPPAIVKWRA
jgi:hypothetical protein